MSDETVVYWENVLQQIFQPFVACMRLQMSGKYQLDNYDNVVENADEIWMVLNGNPLYMPPKPSTGPDPFEDRRSGWQSLFRRWMEGGFPKKPPDDP
jgi:hypothetical protein